MGLNSSLALSHRSKAPATTSGPGGRAPGAAEQAPPHAAQVSSFGERVFYALLLEAAQRCPPCCWGSQGPRDGKKAAPPHQALATCGVPRAGPGGRRGPPWHRQRWHRPRAIACRRHQPSGRCQELPSLHRASCGAVLLLWAAKVGRRWTGVLLVQRCGEAPVLTWAWESLGAGVKTEFTGVGLPSPQPGIPSGRADKISSV